MIWAWLSKLITWRSVRSIAAVCFLSLLPCPAVAQTEGSQTLIAWRLPTGIYLKGSFSGINELQSLAARAGTTIINADDINKAEGRPSSLMVLAISVLSDMQLGRVEINASQFSVEGVARATKVGVLKEQILQRIPTTIHVESLRIDSPEQAPFHWAIVTGLPNASGDSGVTMGGDVISEDARTMLDLSAQIVSTEPRIIDQTRVRLNSPKYYLGVETTLLSQMKILSKGFAWVYDNRFDLVGGSLSIRSTESDTGCEELGKKLPKDVLCRLVDISNNWPNKATNFNPTTASNLDPFTPVNASDVVEATKEISEIDHSSDPRIVDILYATVRAPNKSDSVPGHAAYTGERNSQLEFGRARIRIPEDHKIGRLELPGGLSVFGFDLIRQAPDPNKHFLIRSVQPLTSEQWDDLIDSVGPKDAVIFVHGFNNSFEDGVLRIAQITWDLQYKGLPVLFSWASRGEIADYEYDRNSALVAREAFMQLLDNLREKHGITKVHIIAHSMGSFLVLDALANARQLPGAMGQLILAAPDVDRDQFKAEIPLLGKTFSGLTLYASSNDRALEASMKLAGNIPRAGDVPPDGPIVIQGLDTLDVSSLGEEMFGLNHGTFAEARPLIDDMSLILSQGLRPPRLAEERPVPDNGTPVRYWRFSQ
ncbi:alpha/beta hydrolase [Methylovirgula sp. 4M-Z18]|uniref:alpha/beta hydrolase n=1 Tax=Methylovirgula sp. 4M-Z18 TaxID=2293567 RepID=UPI000E2F5EA3|nr:alpha/beta fold hydrolase [Methylovirgula sp. 4M-Z18]RFB80965.1 alpha/beta fold hydrolase [Methylovirgula sp. 4M-Z18]